MLTSRGYILTPEQAEEVLEMLSPLVTASGFTSITTIDIEAMSSGEYALYISGQMGNGVPQRNDLFRLPMGRQENNIGETLDIFRHDANGKIPSITAVVASVLRDDIVRTQVIRRASWTHNEELRFALERSANLNKYVSGYDIASTAINQ